MEQWGQYNHTAVSRKPPMTHTASGWRGYHLLETRPQQKEENATLLRQVEAATAHVQLRYFIGVINLCYSVIMSLACRVIREAGYPLKPVKHYSAFTLSCHPDSTAKAEHQPTPAG